MFNLFSKKIYDTSQLKKIGFIHKQNQYWYYENTLDSNILFTLILNNTTGVTIIKILDKNTGNTYDYESKLEDNPNNSYVKYIKQRIQEEIEYLRNRNIQVK